MNTGNKTSNSVHFYFQRTLYCHTISFAIPWFLYSFLLWLHCSEVTTLDYCCHAENPIYSNQSAYKICIAYCHTNLWFILHCWLLQPMTQLILITQMKRLIALQLLNSLCLITYSILQSKDWQCPVQGNILCLCIGVLAIVRSIWWYNVWSFQSWQVENNSLNSENWQKSVQ